MKYFIDTNIFLRPIVKDTPKKIQENCRVFLMKVNEGGIQAVTSSLVLSELEWVLRSYYKITRNNIVKTLASINNLKIPYIDNFQAKLAIEMYKNCSVKFVDTQIASIDEIFNKKWTVVSYDKDFDKLRVIRKEPQEVCKETLN